MANRAGRCTVIAQPKIDRRRRRGRQAPALILHSFLTRSLRAGQPLGGHIRAPARSLRLVRARAVRARSRVVDHPTCTSVSHEPTAQQTISRKGFGRPTAPSSSGYEPARASGPRPPQGCIHRWGGDLLPLRDPDRGQRLDDGRGPAAHRSAGPRGARPPALRRDRRRRTARPIDGPSDAAKDRGRSRRLMRHPGGAPPVGALSPAAAAAARPRY
jgi:hypothetical protein